MDAIQLINVTKQFNIRPRSLKEFIPLRAKGREYEEAFDALKGVTLSIKQGAAMGLVGRNGSGKSTLLKIIAGVTPPTYGTVVLRGRVSPLLELGAGFSPELTGRENVVLNGVILGMSRADIASKVDSVLEFAELHAFADMPVKRYSSGMAARLGFAVAVHSQPDILLLDEILAVGDESFRDKCFDAIRRFQAQGVTIVLVSHSAEAITKFCDRAAVLDHGKILFDGTAADAISFYHDLLNAQTPAHADPPASNRS